MPVGLLFEETRVSNPDAIPRAASNVHNVRPEKRTFSVAPRGKARHKLPRKATRWVTSSEPASSHRPARVHMFAVTASPAAAVARGSV
jgi:hypothetical protein